MNVPPNMETLIKELGLFDAQWYIAAYLDVKELNIDPLTHYLKIGINLMRDPGPKFSMEDYHKNHADVKEAGVNPIIHYLTVGNKEQRKIFPSTKELADQKVTQIEQSNVKVALQPNDEIQSLRKENETLLEQLHKVQDKLEQLVLEQKGGSNFERKKI